MKREFIMRKPCVILATLFCNNVNAEWGQQWGSMVWGQSSANAPMMGGFGQLIFFGLLLVIGVFVTKRWGLIKTLPAIALLSLMPLMVDADEIELNTFQNGQVADADDVNENFNNLKQEVQELNEVIKMLRCKAVRGTFLNGSCLHPTAYNILRFSQAFDNINVLNVDTSAFEYESSSTMTFIVYAPEIKPHSCILLNSSNEIVSSLIFNEGDYDLRSNHEIQDRGMHSVNCTSVGPGQLDVGIEFHE